VGNVTQETKKSNVPNKPDGTDQDLIRYAAQNQIAGANAPIQRTREGEGDDAYDHPLRYRK